MNVSNEEICIFWFRRDLRLTDNAGLYHALRSGYKVLPIFIFDKNILNQFEKYENAQVEFIRDTLIELQSQLRKYGSSLLVKQSTPLDFFEDITKQNCVKAVYTNEDYELSARKRDADVANLLKEKSIPLHSYKDQVIFAKGDILTDKGLPYTIFTPYSRKWKSTFADSDCKGYEINNELLAHLFQFSDDTMPTLSELGFTSRNIPFPPKKIDLNLVKNYEANRDYPAISGTSQLGVHLRFGTISIRQLVNDVKTQSETFLNELVWREFYQAITYHFPRINQGLSFKAQYDEIKWRNNEAEFALWCEGKTGYPIVDAGMRELNATGFMHNRVRMICASFLIKHLLIDWRWGEVYFANKLLDFDFAANNGGWQWAASCGCDAVPYFRIFNPSLQAQKFDAKTEYIRKWIPEIGSDKYNKPIVNHDFARKRALAIYGQLLNQK